MARHQHRRTGSQGRWRGFGGEGGGQRADGKVAITGPPIAKERMPAKYGGKCCNCRESIAVGDPIVFFPAPRAKRGKPKKPARIMCDACASLPAQGRAERRPSDG